MITTLILNGNDLNLASESTTFFKGWESIITSQHHRKQILEADAVGTADGPHKSNQNEAQMTQQPLTALVQKITTLPSVLPSLALPQFRSGYSSRHECMEQSK